MLNYLNPKQESNKTPVMAFNYVHLYICHQLFKFLGIIYRVNVKVLLANVSVQNYQSPIQF
jgi:hypothetical protein